MIETVTSRRYGLGCWCCCCSQFLGSHFTFSLDVSYQISAFLIFERNASWALTVLRRSKRSKWRTLPRLIIKKNRHSFACSWIMSKQFSQMKITYRSSRMVKRSLPNCLRISNKPSITWMLSTTQFMTMKSVISWLICWRRKQLKVCAFVSFMTCGVQVAVTRRCLSACVKRVAKLKRSWFMIGSPFHSVWIITITVS